MVSGFRRAAYEQEVEEARTALEAAVREMPATQALARYQYAMVRRSMAVLDLLAARSRLGMPTEGAALPPSADVRPAGRVRGSGGPAHRRGADGHPPRRRREVMATPAEPRVSALEHESWCGPRPGNDEPRIESYTLPRYDQTGVVVTSYARVTRCVECGVQEVAG